ncbi:hypothetical protein LQG66_03980 [Bradyrhizobium ontarionense]|uniref:GcrA cell cycle regulator n=1 Tax=Bradyrhizobium ontarionense TaxID=2898149 RepID=A0ABY3RF42_9BRAD|nr:GcrA family cell cycle regulator [Bradyrhizobium sp. A19]UFZ05486.1 hypothetical protein LQG66_03980 [Bradyrhizobium sp. A19]
MTQADLARARSEVGWTDHRTRIAFALYNSGDSAAKVACLIGGVSRNAVIGKLHRDAGALPDRQPPARSSTRFASRTTAETVIRPAPRLRAPERAKIKADVPRPIVPDQIVDQTTPSEHRKTLMQLTDTCCKWPVGNPGEPGFFFCGTPKPDDGLPYCPAHTRRATAPERRSQWQSPNKSHRALSFS